MTKFQRSQEEPIIEIIDEPIMPLQSDKFGKAKGVIIGGILSGFLITILYIIRKIFIDLMI
jgi:hypothetical protein